MKEQEFIELFTENLRERLHRIMCRGCVDAIIAAAKVYAETEVMATKMEDVSE